MKNCLLALLSAVALNACVAQVPVRASAKPHAAADKLAVSLPADPKTVSVNVTELLNQDGFKLVNSLDAPDGSKILVFKGRRTSVTTVRGNSSMIVGQTNEIGSWFAARIKQGGVTTLLAIIGKPTVRGQELCSDEDSALSDVKYFCQDTKMREDFPAKDLLDGRAEAEEITGVIEKLKMKG